MYQLQVLLFYAIVLLNWSSATLNDNDTYQVVFVNVLHRHGDRTPSYFYPNDPYSNASYWPESMGQLTNRGKEQAFELGQWLRQRYLDLLGDRYSRDVIYVQSTDRDRTLMSAECVMAGMFPPQDAQRWSPDLEWQPIPVHTTPLNLDKVLAQPPKVPCPAYEDELQKVFATDERVKQLNQTYSQLLQWASENSGASFNLLTLYDLYDALFIEDLYNYTLPDWTSKVFPEPMTEANVYSYTLETWTPKLARLQTGLLVQDMIQHMMDKSHNKTSRNLHVYSGHDETIVNVLHALGAFNNIQPPYAACLMMELAVDSSGGHFVSLHYRNSTTEGPYLLTVAGCSSWCPLEKFIDIARPIIPEDWDKECAVSDNGSQNGWPGYIYWLIGVAGVMVIILVLVIVRRCL